MAMKFDVRKVKLGAIYEGFADDDVIGVIGLGGKLNIRPAYQREFFYKGKALLDVIRTIQEKAPLGLMYWAVNDDGTYEVIDGQQRTISFCRYLKGSFSFNTKYFHSLSSEQRSEILNYTVLVCYCQGDTESKKKWFERINIPGGKLTDQELRNAIYSGDWVADARSYFSRPNCPAGRRGRNYITGAVNRQDFLETAIKWKIVSEHNRPNMKVSKDQIDTFMSRHHHDSSANSLKKNFRSIVDWVDKTFTTPREEMKSVDWGSFYIEFGGLKCNPKNLEKDIERLMEDDEIDNRPGIYRYVMNGNEQELDLRKFSDHRKSVILSKQGGKCAICKKKKDIKETHADHIKPWSKGGRTEDSNCQVLCIECNKKKAARDL